MEMGKLSALFNWKFIDKLISFSPEKEHKFQGEMKALDFKFGFFSKNPSHKVTEIQECGFELIPAFLFSSFT